MKTHSVTAKDLAHPKYRADIDGLRAFAVLSVVCFHAFPKLLKGGFVGVDIFFIISGFLISSILLGGLKDGSFSFKEFYIRRILRIFPALIVVLGFCYVTGWLVLLPEEFQQLGKHMMGGAGFVSNLLFWQEAGYFDNSAETKPLLHLWSLGVEEQFYIVWPCLLLLAWKRRALKLTAVIIVASFVFNVIKVHTDSVQVFYSPISRFWELLLGGFLAYLKLHAINAWYEVQHGINGLLNKFTSKRLPTPNPVLLRNGLSILGALLIVFAMIFVHKNKLFPGWWALFPTLGAYLVISVGPEAVFNRRVLSSRPLVGIGLISYPLYLWHWPLLSFAAIMETKAPSLSIRFTAVTLAFVLAWLTYRYIEKPLRFGQHSRGNVVGLLLAMLLMAVMGAGAYLKGNVRQATLTPAILAQVAKLNEPHWGKWSPCPGQGESLHCRILNPLKPADIALVGDSHANHLASGLGELDKTFNKNFINWTSAGCFPLFELELAEKRYFSCDDAIINKALEESMQSKTIKTIILSGYAMLKIQGDRKEFTVDGYVHSTTVKNAKNNAEVLEKALNLTLARLVASGKKVFFLVDIPELNFDPKECVSIRPVYLHKHTDRVPCAVTRASFDHRTADYHRIVAQAKASFPSVKFINTYEFLCNQSLCYAQKDGELLYRDDNHLTPIGSRYLVGKMADELLGL